MRSTILYNTILVLVGMAVAIVLIWVAGFSRQGLIAAIIRISGRPYLLNILQQKIITPQKFLLIKVACYALLVADCLTVFLLYHYRLQVKAGIAFICLTVNNAVASVMAVFKQNTRKSNIVFMLLLGVIAARSIYYLLHFELQYDELWGYNYFTSRPFYFTIFSYNNYPLYELSTQLFKWLPLGMKVNLRLPALLAGLCCCILLFACIKKYAGHNITAFAGTALFACMPVTVFYMLYARGVMFAQFFGIVSFFSMLYFAMGASPKKYLALYVMAGVAGMYSMPSYIYYLFVLCISAIVYAVITKTAVARKLRQFLAGNLFVIAISIMLYLPVIMGSGISFVFATPQNAALVNKLLPDLLFYSKGISTFFTGYPYGLTVLLTITAILPACLKKLNRGNVFLLFFCLLLYLLPTGIYLLQHNTVPERATAFIGFIIPVCFCLVVNAGSSYRLRYVTGVFVLAFFAAGCYISNNHTFLHWSEEKDKKAITIANLLVQGHVKSCYDNSPAATGFYYYYPAIDYYCSMQRAPVDMSVAATNSMRYKPFNPEDEYDCIIEAPDYVNAGALEKYVQVYADTVEGFKIVIKGK